jgi:hypothetical protein
MKKQALIDSSVSVAKEAATCILPSLESEIARINALLDSKSVKTAVASTSSTLASMVKMQADIEEIKKKWGDDGPKKSYTRFQGGDRLAGFLFSMKQLN